MKIAIIGATGFIGAKIVDEALRRKHSVLAASRHPDGADTRKDITKIAVDSHNAAELAQAISGSDVCVVAVTWTNNSIENILDALRRAHLSRAIFVVGAGSLKMPDGRLWLDHMIEQGIAPPTSRSALNALETLRSVNDLDWVAVSPSRDIEPGERTGAFKLGDEDLLVDAQGNSRISGEDFAVAILDEVETPSLSRARFTVGY